MAKDLRLDQRLLLIAVEIALAPIFWVLDRGTRRGSLM